MILTHELTVAAPAAQVFTLLSDVERVATCLPGATLQGREADAYLGTVRVRIGPITASYRGRVSFVEVDGVRRVMRLRARGEDTHGNGDAEADLELAVSDHAAGARLSIRTDLLVRGRIAQFGKGAIPGVSNRILDAFAANLAVLLAGGPATGEATGEAGARAEPARPAAAPVPALSLLVPPALRRRAPVGAAFALGMVQGWLVSRAFGRGRCPEPIVARGARRRP